MDLDEIKQIIDTVIAKDLAEFEYENGDRKIRIRRNFNPGAGSNQAPLAVAASTAAPPGPPIAAQGSANAGAAAVAPTPAAGAAAEAGPEADLLMVTAPIVGTFFEAPSPGAPPFVEVGDQVESGQILCIIEAMKLMNEIEAEASGVVVKRFVSNGQPVEYGEALFAIQSDA